MDRFSFEVESDDAARGLREAADERGRSVEQELAELVTRTYARPSPSYPPGMEPLPGEGVGSWMHRISRPGFELDLPPRGLFELRDPYRDPD